MNGVGDPADKAHKSDDLDEYREDPELGPDAVENDIEVGMREAEFMAPDRDESWEDYVGEMQERWDVPRARLDEYRLKRPQLVDLLANETGADRARIRDELQGIEERVYGGAVTFREEE